MEILGIQLFIGMFLTSLCLLFGPIAFFMEFTFKLLNKDKSLFCVLFWAALIDIIIVISIASQFYKTLAPTLFSFT
jgi:hypothetical protein